MADEQANADVSAETTETPTAQPELTEDQLMAELETALASKDFKAVAAASRKLDTYQKTKDKAELAEKTAALDKMSDKVKQAIMKAVDPLVKAGDLDAADGVWFSFDFGEKAPVVRLMKTAPRQARAGGGGGGKKFDISTDDMLAKHGQEQFNDGLTFQQAYESSTDKNWRYNIRQQLLKLEGII